jgi:hypothetical protein
VLDDLAFVVESEDVYDCGVPGLVVRVNGDQVARRDDAVNFEVDRSGRCEERLHRSPSVVDLRVVLDVVFDDQLFERVGVA